MSRSFRLVTPKNSFAKNGYYERKVRELLGTDMTIVKYGRDKVLNGDSMKFVKINIQEMKLAIILFQVTVL